MDVEINSSVSGQHCQLKMSGELTIYTTTAIKEEMLGYLSNTDHLDIHLAGISEIDCAGVQLLYLVKREARSANKTVTLTAHSAATMEAIELLNLGAYFGDPIVLVS